MNPSGRPRVEQDVEDLSVLYNTGLKGINAVIGITERGEIGKSVLIGSWNEFVKHFGGLVPYSDFPYLCRRAIARGAILRVTRVGHYTNIEDRTTLVGTKASKTGTTTASAVKLTASSVGTWGNGLTVNVSAAKSGNAGYVDIKVALAGYPDYGYTVYEVPAVITSDAIAFFNKRSDYVKLSAGTLGGSLLTEFPTSVTQVLAGGAFDHTSVVATDYIGSPIAGNGLHVFDDEVDFVKIAAPEVAIPAVDDALIAYATLRKDCRAVLRTPVGISGNAGIEYRLRTGAYENSGVAPDTWFADMFFGGIFANHPTESREVHVTAVGDVLGAMSARDSKSKEWFTVAGPRRGVIVDNLGVDYNLASPARATEFDNVSSKGLNAIVKDATYGTVIWDNVTLWRKDTLLKHSNVADLLIYINRAVAPLAKSEMFEPNDIETWKAIYRKVRPLLQLVKDLRGIWDYKYEGDQLVDSIEQAVINKGNDVDSGAYVFLMWIKPKVGLKYIGIKTMVTNSGVSFEELSEERTTI